MDLLRRVRLLKGMHIQQVAELTGLHYTTVSKAEGARGGQDETILKLAEALKVPSDVLFYSMGRLPPDKRELVADFPLQFMKETESVFDKMKKQAKSDQTTYEMVQKILQEGDTHE